MKNNFDNEPLKTHYHNLYQQALEKFRTDNYEIDTQIGDPADRRFGITLLIRPPKEITDRISSFLEEIRRTDPTQYYYRPSDMHITVMSIISCYAGFQLQKINTADYIALIQKSIADTPPFQIRFSGITASPSCVLVQGFFQDDRLNEFRNKLRDNFRASNLEHSIDTRYAIRTAHSTVLRLTHTLHDKEVFLKKLEKYEDDDFGTFAVDSIELVANDWYQRKEKVQQLHTFILKDNSEG